MARLSTVSAIVRSGRPKQWPKNGFVLAGVIFANRVTDLPSVISALEATAIFCALSSAIYIINDIGDREADRAHPKKRLRPIAAGLVSVGTAVVVAAAIIAGSLIAAASLNIQFAIVAVIYFIVNLGYTLWFKHMVVIDVLSVSSGFMLRMLAGTIVVHVQATPWILACTFFLALFVSLAKRRSECILLGDNAQVQRKILADYPPEFLDLLIAIVSSLTIIAYALFTFSAGHSRILMATIPFVIYGMFRYLFLLYVRKNTDPPDVLILGDWPLLVNVLLWVVFAGVVKAVWG